MALDSDQAKTKKGQDALGFVTAADSVATNILDGDYPDGFVIGIEGDWGSGKTTFINFIRQSLNEQAKKDSKKFKVLEFNPWLHSSHENLIAAYFKILRENAKDIFSNDDKIKEILGHVIDIFNPAIGAIVNLATAGIAGESVVVGIDKVNEKIKESPTLESQYKNIQEELTKAKKPFLVVIDDLDRLDSDEIKTMLKLVKSVGKLPYVIYILSYNRAYIENATYKEMPNFLEKIVQFPVHIPKPVQNKLTTMLTDYALKDFFKNINRNEARWQKFVDSGLYYYIKKPRSVHLLSNSIKFRFPAMNGILNPMELFVLETLRLFDANVWNWIRDNKDIVIRAQGYDFSQQNKEQTTQDLEKSLLLPTPLSQNQKTILIRLFPKLSVVLKIKHSNIHETVNEINRDKTIKLDSIATESVYDAYFAQYLEDTEISKADIDRFIENADDKKKTTQTLKHWMAKKDAQGNSKIEEFLRLFSSYFEEPESHEPPKNLLWSLAEVLDDVNSLEDLTIIIEKWSPDQQIRFTFIRLFKKMGQDKTALFLEELCNNNKLISTATFLLYYVGYLIGRIPHNEEAFEQIDLITESDWEHLTKIIAPHLRNAFLNGKVAKFSNIGFAEFLAIYIFDDSSANTKFPKLQQYIIKYIKSCLKKRASKDDEMEFEFGQTKYSSFFDYDVMAEYADGIDLEKQNELTRNTIRAFINTPKRA